MFTELCLFLVYMTTVSPFGPKYMTGGGGLPTVPHYLGLRKHKQNIYYSNLGHLCILSTSILEAEDGWCTVKSDCTL